MKYVLLIVLVLILGTMAFIFDWFGTNDQPVVESAPWVEAKQTIEIIEEDMAIEEARYAAIQAEYKKLEKARRNLSRRLARIKAVMWNVELPAEQAEEIVARIRKGYELLKTKKLLGAFSGIQSVSDELVRVEFAYKNLEGIQEEIKAVKATTN